MILAIIIIILVYATIYVPLYIIRYFKCACVVFMAPLTDRAHGEAVMLASLLLRSPDKVVTVQLHRQAYACVVVCMCILNLSGIYLILQPSLVTSYYFFSLIVAMDIKNHGKMNSSQTVSCPSVLKICQPEKLILVIRQSQSEDANPSPVGDEGTKPWFYKIQDGGKTGNYYFECDC